MLRAGLRCRMLIGGPHQQLLTPFCHQCHCVRWRSASLPGQQKFLLSFQQLAFRISIQKQIYHLDAWNGTHYPLALAFPSCSVDCLHTSQPKGRAGLLVLVLSHRSNITAEKQKLPPINTRKCSAPSASSESSCRLWRLCVNVITL